MSPDTSRSWPHVATYNRSGLSGYVFELPAVAALLVVPVTIPHSKHLPTVKAEVAAKWFSHRERVYDAV